MAIYGYMHYKELENLVIDGRSAFVVTEVHSADTSEYISNMLITLANIGFNTKLLTRCKLLKINNCNNIVITIRKQVVLTDKDRLALESWKSRMGNVVSAQEFIRRAYNNNLIEKLSRNITCCVDTHTSKIKNFKIKLTLNFDNNGNIVSAKATCPEYTLLNNGTIKPLCKNDITSIIHSLYKEIYKANRYTISKCYYTMDGRLLKYIVVPTAQGIQLKLV